MRESALERRCCALARRGGWLVYKWPAGGGVPDRIFLRAGRVVFVEFKSKRGRPSPQQRLRLAEMTDAGAEVHIIDDEDDFARALGL
jgi:hypothetical protein